MLPNKAVPADVSQPPLVLVLGKRVNDRMNSGLRIAIVGDFEAERLSHKATNEALRHGADALNVLCSTEWVATQMMETEAGRIELGKYNGVFCAPGEYRSMNGALAAIRFARERSWPFLGT
jgi:CTP synthase (UTP-ammonia lyase)